MKLIDEMNFVLKASNGSYAGTNFINGKGDAINKDLNYNIVETLNPPGISEIVRINFLLKNIMENAPSDSIFEFDVAKVNSGFKAVLTIISEKIKFTSARKNNQFLKVIEETFQDTERQIALWRAGRNFDPQLH